MRQAISASVDRIGRQLGGPLWPLVRGQVAARVTSMSDADLETAVRAVVREADELRRLLR